LKERQLDFSGTQLPKTWGFKAPPKNDSMILFVDIDLKEVSLLGRKFPWQKPVICPCCHQSHLWGHGFSDTFFEGFINAVLMRRYICPACGCVIKCRPRSHFPRIQTAIDRIKNQLAVRIETGRWPSPEGRERCRHWLSALKRQSLAHLGLEWRNRLVSAFERLRRLGLVPVSRFL
jgi:hypothetical protein